MYSDLTNLTIGQDDSIHQAIALMEVSRVGIVLVVNTDQKLLGTITDGDLRRAILADVDLEDPVNVLLTRKAGSPHARPISAPVGAGRSTLLDLFQEHRILHLPLVDNEERVVGLVTVGEFLAAEEEPLQAVIMAGGMGSRMLPLTQDVPKPMLPVGDQPLLEIIVKKLRDAGIKHINVAVHHKSGIISDHFGDGKEFGVDITYANEAFPLGTAGALGLIEPPSDTSLVINGDILTQVDLRAMLAYHREHAADLTVAVQRHDFQVPYGVIECEGTYVKGLSEKPSVRYFINAGIYLLEPRLYGLIPKGVRCDMTDLINTLLEEGRPVTAFPVGEYWMDIGQVGDYQQANVDILEGKVRP